MLMTKLSAKSGKEVVFPGFDYFIGVVGGSLIVGSVVRPGGLDQVCLRHHGVGHQHVGTSVAGPVVVHQVVDGELQVFDHRAEYGDLVRALHAEQFVDQIRWASAAAACRPTF